MPSTPRALGALEFPVPVLCDNGAPPQAPRLLPLNEGQPPAGPQGLPARSAAGDRAGGRRAPSEARAFGYVRTNSHVFQQSPPLPFGHFDAVRRAGIRLPPPPPGHRTSESGRRPFHSSVPASPRPSCRKGKSMPGPATDERSRPPEPMFHFLRIRCSTSSGFRVPLPGFDVPLPPDSMFHFLRIPCSTSSRIPTA